MSPTPTPTPSPTPMLLIITPLYTSQEGAGITWALWFPVPCDETQQWIIKKTYAGSTKNISNIWTIGDRRVHKYQCTLPTKMNQRHTHSQSQNQRHLHRPNK